MSLLCSDGCVLKACHGKVETDRLVEFATATNMQMYLNGLHDDGCVSLSPFQYFSPMVASPELAESLSWH